MGVGHKPEPAEATAFRPQILVDDFSVYADTVLDGFTEFVNEQPGWSLTPDNHEGVHVTAENGWILVQTVF